MGSDMSASIHAVAARIEAEAGALAQPAISPEATQGAAGGATTAVGFADRLREAIRDVDARDRLAAEQVAAVDAGRSDDLVGAMLASQEASLSFSMLMQTRNKVVGALEDLIKLQL